jgi:hypothetical protein
VSVSFRVVCNFTEKVNQFTYDTSPAHAASLDTTVILGQFPLLSASRKVSKYISAREAKDSSRG